MEVGFSRVPVWVSTNLSPLSANSYIQSTWLFWFQITRSLATSDLMESPLLFEKELCKSYKPFKTFSSFIQKSLFVIDVYTR